MSFESAIVESFKEIVAAAVGVGMGWGIMKTRTDENTKLIAANSKRIAEIEEQCELHKKTCPQAVFNQLTTQATALNRIAEDVAYMRGRMDEEETRKFHRNSG